MVTLIRRFRRLPLPSTMLHTHPRPRPRRRPHRRHLRRRRHLRPHRRRRCLRRQQHRQCRLAHPLRQRSVRTNRARRRSPSFERHCWWAIPAPRPPASTLPRRGSASSGSRLTSTAAATCPSPSATAASTACCPRSGAARGTSCTSATIAAICARSPTPRVLRPRATTTMTTTSPSMRCVAPQRCTRRQSRSPPPVPAPSILPSSLP